MNKTQLEPFSKEHRVFRMHKGCLEPFRTIQKEERAFWNPRRFATKISPSSHLIASNADDTKELLPSNKTDKNSELREKKEGRSGDPEIWSNSTMLKSNETIPFQDQIENQVSEDKNSQEIFNRTQHRRSYNSRGIFYPELAKEDNSKYYDFQHARKALSYTLTTPRLPTVKYSYKKINGDINFLSLTLF